MISALIALVILLLALYIVSFLVSKREEMISDITTQTNESGTITIGVTDETLITALSWSYEGEKYTLEYKNGAWANAEDNSFPLNQSVVSAMVDAVSGLEATQAIPNVSAMKQYGLVTPDMTIQVTADGERINYKIGDLNPLTDEYYLQINTLATVYLVDSTLLDSFSKGEMDLLQMETVPDFGTVTSATVENASGTFKLIHEETDDGESWYLDDADKTPLDADAASKLVNYGLGTSWLRCQNYNASQYDIEACGLSEPAAKITLMDSDGNGFTLVFGDETEDGTFAQFEGSNMIYVVGTDTAQYIENATVESLLPQASADTADTADESDTTDSTA